MTTSKITLGAALAAHLEAEGVPPGGGYDEAWVKTRVGPFPFAYPNTEGRKRIARAHDLHHVLTGCRTDLRGEGELAAWELGSGLSDKTGIRLAIRVFGFALVWAPRVLFDAFLRGRRSGNLFDAAIDETLLARERDEVRRELGLDLLPSASQAADRRAFAVWACKGLAIVWGPLIPIAALLWLWLR